MDPKRLIDSVRKVFLFVNRDLPFLYPRTLLEHMGAATFVQFVGSSLLSVLGDIRAAPFYNPTLWSTFLFSPFAAQGTRDSNGSRGRTAVSIRY